MRQGTGVILIAVGALFVIGAAKGTWRKIWDAALGKDGGGGGGGGTQTNSLPGGTNGRPTTVMQQRGQTNPFTPGQLALTDTQAASLVTQTFNGSVPGWPGSGSTGNATVYQTGAAG